MLWDQRHLLVLSLLILLLGSASLYNPHIVNVKLKGQSTLTVPADRATITLRVSYEGSKQQKVADNVRKTSEDILGLLRPLTLPPTRTPGARQNGTEELLPPLATLAVDAFSSSSWGRPRLIGDEKIYTSSVTIKAEFRSLPRLHDTNATINTQTVIPGAGFHQLSLVLPSLSKVPNTKIDYLRWFLSPDTLAVQESAARQGAMVEMLNKIADFTAPMGLKFPIARCLRFQEDKRYMPYDHRLDSFDSALRSQSSLHVQYDEIDDGYDYGYEIENQKAEAFGMEPQSIAIMSTVEGDWRIIEQGLVRSWLAFLV
jgi:hypothetical protein